MSSINNYLSEPMKTQLQIILAWGVHLFTSMGILAAFMAIIAIDKGHPAIAYLWLFCCFVIDGLDGSLARKVKVTEVLPNMHGKNIDYIIDFSTYALIPAFFFYKTNMVSDHLMYPALAMILLSSALYYGKNNMVEDEQYFIGFPVLWNFVVFFQYFVFQNQLMLNFISVFIFGILHFVPLRYAYPSRARQYFIPHFIVSMLSLGSALFLLLKYPHSPFWTKCISVIGGIYFFAFAIFETIKLKSKG